LLVFLVPYERGAFASKVDEWASDGRVTLDPDAHVARDAKKGADIGEVLTFRPVTNLGHLGVIRDAAVIVAFVSENDDFGDGDEKFLCRDGGTGAEKSMEYAVDVIQMFPDEAADLIVSRNRFVPSILGFITRWRAFDASVVHKGVGLVGDLGLEDEDYITVEYCAGSGPSLQ
jgi:hypothetical protein